MLQLFEWKKMSAGNGSLELGLDQGQLEALRDAIEKDDAYQSTRERMRAAVLLCIQELINGAQPSAFQAFHRVIPDAKNGALAIAAAADFLRAKGLLHTLSVLTDEIDLEALAQGQAALGALVQGAAPASCAIAQIQAISGH
jgi:hypothetical protein